jgi:primosomal protein N' (replication factor Y)
VVVQTRHPQHHALLRAAQHDTEGFLRQERELRRAPPYPPELHLVNLIVSGQGEADTAARAAEVADWCNALVARHELEVTVLGPAPCPLARIKDRWRWHVLLKGPSPVLGRIVRYAARRLRSAGRTRVVIDRDPVSLL